MILELLKNKPYFLLLLAAISFLILSFIVNKKETLDFNVHDTYYVITFQHAYILLCLIFFITGLIYFIFNFFEIQFISILSLIHVYGSLIFLGVFFYYLGKINSSSIFDSIDYNLRTIISLLIFAGLQLLFVFNILLKLSSFFLKSTSK
jgi:heme/copper-type cytochrome/quinol oxidase subunit 1